MHRQRGQLGETLLEGLVAILIISLVAAAAYAGLRTAMRSSGQHKELAVAETLLRSAAERLQDPKSEYIVGAACGGAPDYADPLRPEPLPTEPDYEVSVSVAFWAPTAASGPQPISPTFLDCPAPDPGLQRLTLTVETPSGFTQSLDLLKRSD